MPKWLQYYIGGEGSLGTPKNDYVLCARPLIALPCPPRINIIPGRKKIANIFFLQKAAILWITVMLPRNTHKFLPADVNDALDDPSLLEIIEGVSNIQHQDVKMKKSMSRMLCSGRCRWEGEECARSNLRLTGGTVKRLALPCTFRFVGVFCS